MEENKRPFDYIIEFLLNPHNPNNKIGYDIFFKVFLKEFNKYSLLKNELEPEDVYSEFLLKIIFKGDKFSLNPTILNKIQENTNNITSYLYMTMHNFLRTKNRELKEKFYVEENNQNEEKRLKKKFETLEIKHDNDDKYIENPKITKSPVIETEIMIEAKEIREIIEQKLSDKEKQVLCYTLLDDPSYIKEEISQDALYKRKSRMKKFLTGFVKEHGFSLEGFSYFVQEYLKSEICEKYR